MQTPDEDEQIGKMTYVKNGTSERFETPIERGQELFVLPEDDGVWVVSKEGSRFVHLCRLFPGDKVTIEVL